MNRTIPTANFKFVKTAPNTENGPSPEWAELTTNQLFSGRRTIVFSLPGAFTPTCSTYQLPLYDTHYPEFRKLGIDEVFCISVNDPFVMEAWRKHLGIENIQLLPDGNADFTRKMGMLVSKANLGFGMRSWRYAAIINDAMIESWFEEPGFKDDCPDDPYGETTPQVLLDHLRNSQSTIHGVK